MSRCVIVLGIPRSGTSAVAGTLSALGVNMGDGHLQPGNKFNERGYYEDLRWQALNKTLVGERYGHRRPTELTDEQQQTLITLANGCRKLPLWGIKDPRLCFTLHLYLPYLGRDVRIVAVWRDFGASVDSLVHHSQHNYRGHYAMTGNEAAALLCEWQDAMRQRLMNWTGALYRLRYEQLLEKPGREVERLAGFAFEGLDAKPDTRAGVAFVARELNHHG